MRMRRNLGLSLAVAVVISGTLVTATVPIGADNVVARAHLIDNSGARVGHVKFTSDDSALKGKVTVTLPASTPASQFRGFHIHANAASTGCVVGTGFTGVGGHWDVGGHEHGNHTGDLPSLHRTSSGQAEATFAIDKFGLQDLIGKALIVHAGPDNFANVPIGSAGNQYSDNGTAFYGTGGTAATGNAGTRYACGVIEAN